MNEYKQKSWFFFILEKLSQQYRYFGDHTGLHGIRYVFSMSHIPLFKRLFWFFVLLCSSICAAVILLEVLKLYSEGAGSFLVETNYLEFDTPFPAVTICETQNNDGIKAYITEHKLPLSVSLFFKDITFWTPKFCKYCANCKNTTCFADFIEAVAAVRSKCPKLLTDCWWDNKRFSCCERFLPMETEYDVCYTFNSRLTGNETSLIVNRQIGLPYLVFLAPEEIAVRIHSPDDMVSVATSNVLGRPVILPKTSDFEVLMQAEQTISDISVSTMSLSMRGCLYKDEKPALFPNWPFKRYSHSACMLYCRMTAQVNFCNCTHHLMPQIEGFPFCDIRGLTCLNQNQASFQSLVCECPMSCEEVDYHLVHMFLNRHNENTPPEVKAKGTRGIVKLAQLPALRVRREAIRHTLGLVVDIGGIGGVFFGASLLNVIEIIYLVCIRRHS